MKEYEVGEQITLEVQEYYPHSCKECFFYNTPIYGCCNAMCDGSCSVFGESIIFIEKKGKHGLSEQTDKLVSWLNDIADRADHLTTGNVSHNKAYISGKARRAAEYLQKHSVEP